MEQSPIFKHVVLNNDANRGGSETCVGIQDNVLIMYVHIFFVFLADVKSQPSSLPLSLFAVQLPLLSWFDSDDLLNISTFIWVCSHGLYDICTL